MEKRMITRRTALGLGAAAAASLLLAGTRLAWAGVGGGAWGAYGGTAVPGAHFGYDAGWSYSYDGCVWLSASCNCTVGRMTELFLEVGVEAYVACGGIWSPTWSPDIPDTPTHAFIRDDTGVWLTSQYWNIDTTYDHSYYVHMVGARLRIPRREYDWRCWCGADIKGLGGSAPGTHSVAEAPQYVPRHPLIDDRSWQGKIVTLRPRSAEHLYMDVMGGGVVEGSNIAAWSITHTTNQNWLVLTSAQGRTCLVPVHLGENARFVDLNGADWNDGDNVHLWVGNGSPAQSMYLHSLGNGYHLIVFECSGCALDLVGGGQADGTNIQQWNCYGNWNSFNQHWKLEEPVFRERVAGSLSLQGEPRSGLTLTLGNPNDACFPYNFPGTSGMFWRYTWYRGAAAGERAAVARSASEQASYVVTEADEGCYLTCVITAHTRYAGVQYKGEVVPASVYVPQAQVTVRYFADGEAVPCYEETARMGDPYYSAAAAHTAAAKPQCAGLDGWYTDAAGTQGYAEGAALQGDFALYAFNKVEVSYAQAENSFLRTTQAACFLDEALVQPVVEQSLLPEATVQRYGTRITFVLGVPVWYEDMGRARQVPCTGAYATPNATGVPLRTVRLTANTCAYLLWRPLAYDGIALS